MQSGLDFRSLTFLEGMKRFEYPGYSFPYISPIEAFWTLFHLLEYRGNWKEGDHVDIAWTLWKRGPINSV